MSGCAGLGLGESHIYDVNGEKVTLSSDFDVVAGPHGLVGRYIVHGSKGDKHGKTHTGGKQRFRNKATS